MNMLGFFLIATLFFSQFKAQKHMYVSPFKLVSVHLQFHLLDCPQSPHALASQGMIPKTCKAFLALAHAVTLWEQISLFFSISSSLSNTQIDDSPTPQSLHNTPLYSFLLQLHHSIVFSIELDMHKPELHENQNQVPFPAGCLC